jgi:hypothetical protein
LDGFGPGRGRCGSGGILITVVLPKRNPATEVEWAIRGPSGMGSDAVARCEER